MRPLFSTAFSFGRKMRFTLAVVSINAIVFFLTWYVSGSTSGAIWTRTLLQFGAQFAPLTLDREGYRILSHLFLHASLAHLLLNQYVLLYLGRVVEIRVGAKKFALVYFASGAVAALSSMYWNLFSVGVGTSGAIGGLFGFYLVYTIVFNTKSVIPTIVLLLHFAIFAFLHLLLPDTFSADYAALFGGVIAGIGIGFISFGTGRRTVASINLEYLVVPLVLILFLLMPGYQVRYFKFFKQVVAAEDTTRHLIKETLTDDDMRTFIRNYHHWEEIESRLALQSGLPADLSPDTFRLARYIDLRKHENLLKKMVVQNEAYVYLDSVDRLQQVMRKYMDLDYGLWSRIKGLPADSADESRMVKVYYDSMGAEIKNPPADFHRIGVRDSLGRWNGPFREYDHAGRLRVKGSYKSNRRDGVFLYYNANGLCKEAGRFMNDKKYGKWQTFYATGRLASEIFYGGGTFVRSVWDSLGNQLVVDGNGREIQVYPDDVVKVVGEYRHGVKEGIWHGRYPNGEMYYEEHYNQGVLISGKSRSPDGQTFIYDESSLFPFPEGGFENFSRYLKDKTKKYKGDEVGHVKLSFLVSSKGRLVDVTIEQGATATLDQKAKEILLNGPRWFPARVHGHKPVDAYAAVQVEFY